MARKATSENNEPAGGDKPVRLLLPPDVHNRLRVVAAENDQPMAAYVRSLVINHLEEHDKKKK